MFFTRFIIIFISLLLVASFEVSFAATGSGMTESGTTSIKVKKIDKNEKEVEKDINSNSGINNEEDSIEEKKTENNAQKIILEVYKIQ